MTTYYYYEDAVGSADGLSEANAYDGSTSTTMPNGTTNTCTFNNVVSTLLSGDTLYVKKSSSPISLTGSLVTGTNANDGPTRYESGGTQYGYIEIIGYQDTIDDNLRADFNFGGFTFRLDREFARVKNINVVGSYGGGMFRIQNGARIENSRLENTRTGSGIGYALDILEGFASRCELIGNYSTASPADDEATVNMYYDNGAIENCYIEARNGAHGISARRHALPILISNNIIVTNLDVDGSGNSNGNGIHAPNVLYHSVFTIKNNIIYNSNDGIAMPNTLTDNRCSLYVSGNIISNCVNGINVGDNINGPSDVTAFNVDDDLYFGDNFYHACTTSTTNCNSEINITVLSSDPFVDAANKDFTIARPSDFGYASKFFQESRGASGDTITRNALVNIAPFTTTDSGIFSLGTGGVGDTVNVSGRSYQKVSDTPIVWRVS